MVENKQNLQLFFFIAGFFLFVCLLPRFLDFTGAGMTFGAPLNEWEYINSLGVFPEKWQETGGELPVSRREALEVFAAIEGQEDFDNYSKMLEISGVFLDGNEAVLRREELYRLLARTVNIPADADCEKFFLKGETEDLPLDYLAQEGIIAVPPERVFLPAEKVTRRELVQTVARAAWPAFRITNTAVTVVTGDIHTYGKMEYDLQVLFASYHELLDLQVIGQSVEGRNIYAVCMGNGPVEIFLDASIHGSEWLTTALLMKMLEEYAYHAHNGLLFGGYDVNAMLEEVTFWFLPMLNPDGVTLVLEGPEAVEHEKEVRKILLENGKNSFDGWKANIRGVDLNRQFPTNWHYLVKVESKPAPGYFKGSEPLSEPEAQALYEFTLARKPAMVLSFHQQGEILYWYYKQKGEQLARDRRIVQALSVVTGYPYYPRYLINGGKYMDWVISELAVPAIIIEVGTKVGDLGQWDRIWRQNRYVGLAAAELILLENRTRQ